MSTLSCEELKSLVVYDPDTGVFTNKVNRGPAKAGSSTGYTHSSGYIQIGIKGKQYYAHRLAWLYHYGTWPEMSLDHKDGNRSNNAIDNLRLATSSENNRNRAKAGGSSMYTGVSWDRSREKWEAYIWINNKKKFLGRFELEADAARAYNKAASEVSPDFANLNEVDHG